MFVVPSSLNCTPATLTLSDAVADTVTAVPDTVAPPAGADIVTVGGVVSVLLLTVTVTVPLVVVLPAASRAVADSVWLPLAAVVEFHTIEYGLVVSSAPMFVVPSSLNCTPATPTLSDAVADTVTVVPDTVAPPAGADIVTAGGVVSLLLTVIATAALVVVLPAASRAIADSVWLPLAAVVEFHMIEYGLVVSSAPMFVVPSSLNCTPATPTSSDAVADTVTVVPDTVAPPAGADIVTIGGVVSLLLTVIATAALVVVLPAASRAIADSVWLPLAAVVEFHTIEYGLLVSSAPM